MMGSDGSVLLAAAAVGSNEAKAQAIADERKVIRFMAPSICGIRLVFQEGSMAVP